MSTQNDVNKQFSANNNATFGSYVTLIGAFISVFYLYIKVLLNKCCHHSDSLFFVTLLAILVLAFLACLSVNLGYGRRRDHIVASASDLHEPYRDICGDGTDKGFLSYLLGAYRVFYLFFFLSLVLFAVYSSILFLFLELGKYALIIAIIGGSFSLFAFLYYIFYYCCKYKLVKSKAADYTASHFNGNSANLPASINNTTTKTINVTVNS